MYKDIFQKIFDELQDVLPAEWKKIVFYAVYFDESYSMKYFVDKGSGNYEDCFSIREVTEKNLVKTFMRLDKVISPIREKLSEKEKWYCLTMKVGLDGEFFAKYNYNPIDDLPEYEKVWKKDYL